MMLLFLNVQMNNMNINNKRSLSNESIYYVTPQCSASSSLSIGCNIVIREVVDFFFLNTFLNSWPTESIQLETKQMSKPHLLL